MKIPALFSCLFFLLVGCEPYLQNEDYEEYYVVESYLIADRTLPHVRLSTSSNINEEYQFSDSAVPNATVEIHLLNADSSIAEIYSYMQHRPGLYFPEDSVAVRDERLYRLRITTPEGHNISSTTFVPQSFSTVKKPDDKYIYQGHKQVELTVTPSSYITGRQTYYIFTANVVDPKPENLTPFYSDLIASQDNFIGSYYINPSGIIDQEKYRRDADGNITVTLPWLTVVFYGQNDITVNALDDNMYHFLRSRDLQTGGIAVAPGEIQNIRYNVEGGIGIFGSMASDTNRVVIIRPEE